MTGKMDEGKGRAERAAGELLDDDGMKHRGDVDKATGKVKDKVDKAGEWAREKLDRS